jgi:hypothetical protein
VKGYLLAAESDLKAGNFTETVIKSVAGLQWTLRQVRESETFKPGHKSVEVFRAFQHMRDLLMSTIIGLNFQAHLRYKKITTSVVVMSFMADGNYSCNLRGYTPGRGPRISSNFSSRVPQTTQKDHEGSLRFASSI